MTAPELNRLAKQAATQTDIVNGTAEQHRLTGIVFDYAAPLPPMRPHGHDPAHSWEPAARRYRDIEPEEVQA
jgi:hypothetical protein